MVSRDFGILEAAALAATRIVGTDGRRCRGGGRYEQDQRNEQGIQSVVRVDDRHLSFDSHR
jgi:hypothetical protein